MDLDKILYEIVLQKTNSSELINFSWTVVTKPQQFYPIGPVYKSNQVEGYMCHTIEELTAGAAAQSTGRVWTYVTLKDINDYKVDNRNKIIDILNG